MLQPRLISSGRVVRTITRAQRNLLHTWIILAILKQYLVQIGRTDGPSAYLSQTLTAIRFLIHRDRVGVDKTWGRRSPKSTW